MEPFFLAFRHLLEPHDLPSSNAAVGPQVYLILSPVTLSYPRGTSVIKYIGFATLLQRRLANHPHLGPADSVARMDVARSLREIKRDDPTWSRMTKREHNSALTTPERFFLHYFKKFYGALPALNRRDDAPTREAMIVGEMLLRGGMGATTAAAGDSFQSIARNEERVDASVIVHAVRARFGAHLQQHRAGNGAVVLADANKRHQMMIFEYDRHCRVRVRCASEWGTCRVQRHMEDRNASGWLGAQRVATRKEVQKVLLCYGREWG